MQVLTPHPAPDQADYCSGAEFEATQPGAAWS